jgi:putative Ca2+/H+ antiporter (TMEM165/GDT1 family)
LIAIFIAVFVAELGDKTQLATVLIAADKDHHPLAVFAAAGAALLTSTAIAVGFGTLAAKYLDAFPLKLIAGCGFLAIGTWMVFEHVKGTA